MVGGALGNMIDRVFRGTVVDYFDLHWWPVFNVADVAIVVGVIIVVSAVLLSMRSDSMEGETEREKLA
jgi:signal peptidase II